MNVNQNNILKVIDKARKAIPYLNYAIGIWAIIGIVTLISISGVNLKLAVWGCVIILFLMTVLYLLAKAAKSESLNWKTPAISLLWAIVLLFILTITFLFTSVFFSYPRDLKEWLIDNKMNIPEANEPLNSPNKSSIQELDSNKSSLKKRVYKSFKITPHHFRLIEQLETSGSFVFDSKSKNDLAIFCDGDIIPVSNSKLLYFFSGGNIVLYNKGNECRTNLPIRIERTDPAGNTEEYINGYIESRITLAIESNLPLIAQEAIKCIK